MWWIHPVALRKLCKRFISLLLCSLYCLCFSNMAFFIPCSRYTFSSIESQIRVLGDYAFMLRDYELALSNYRLISTDYKLDKAWKRFAGTQVGLMSSGFSNRKWTMLNKSFTTFKPYDGAVSCVI